MLRNKGLRWHEDEGVFDEPFHVNSSFGDQPSMRLRQHGGG
jgi:hypothetical protein